MQEAYMYCMCRHILTNAYERNFTNIWVHEVPVGIMNDKRIKGSFPSPFKAPVLYPPPPHSFLGFPFFPL